MEQYIYLRNTQKQQKITNYVGNKSFLEFYLVYNGVCLKFLGSLLEKLADFAPLCIKIEGWFCVTTFDVLSTFYSVFVYISNTVRCPSSTDYTQKLAAPQCLHYPYAETFSKKWHPSQRINIGMTTFT